MSHNANANCLKGSILLYLVVFVNIVVAAYLAEQNFFWMLSASVPILIIAIYIGQIQVIVNRLRHSFPHDKVNEAELRLIIGNEQCRKPHNPCFFNVETKKQRGSTSSDKPVREEHQIYKCE